jgi:LEA14-like dessication related protein
MSSVLPHRQALFAGLLALPLLLGGCALTRRDLEPPKVTLKGVTPESMTQDGQVFRCRLLLENPNTEDLKVVGGRVTLDLAGVSAASARPMEDFVLPGLESKLVDMRVTMDLLSALPGVLGLLTSGRTELDYTLKGYVDLDVKALGRLPFKSTGKVTLDNLLRQLPGLVRPVPPSPPDDPPDGGPET